MIDPDFRRGRARSSTEMRFAMSLVKCKQCGTRVDPEVLRVEGSGEAWAWTGGCARCQSPLWFTFRSYGDPVAAPVPTGELGDARPSEILQPGHFLAEIDRLVPLVRSDPSQLDTAAWKQTRDHNRRVMTCLIELAKFLPAGAQALDPSALSAEEIADRAARPERYRRAWIEDTLRARRELHALIGAELPRITAEEARRAPPPVVGTLDRASLRAHDAWVRRGQTGAGRLVLVGVRAPRERIGAALLTGASLDGVDFTEVDLSYADLEDTELTGATFTGANLTSIQLRGSRLRGGTFAKAAMALAKLERTVIEASVFTGADLERSQWHDARVSDARFEAVRFGNAALDRAVFARCDFRRADFAPTDRLPAPTTAATRFEDCDLRDTRWQGRELAGAVFVRCKLAGVAGRPASLDGVVIEAPDLSIAGDGSDLGTIEDVFDLWAGG
jgi:uncharacterized protein YjbI with pentapeptide repeats